MPSNFLVKFEISQRRRRRRMDGWIDEKEVEEKERERGVMNDFVYPTRVPLKKRDTTVTVFSSA